MNKIKVYLQYPWKFPDSPYYKYLIENPPENVQYLNADKQKGVIINKKFLWISNSLKKYLRRFVDIFKITFPNAPLSPEGDYDLIHCAHCLSKNIDKPWTADFESLWQMYIGKKTERAKNKVREILQKENCKKIIAWTEETKKEIIEDFPEIKNKVDIIYPAIPVRASKKKQKKKINLIFSGRYFYWKGGPHALEIIDQLTKKYPSVYGIVNSETPEEIKKKYSQNSKIKFYDLIPQDKLFELYEEADIMIYPGYTDTFGFAFLEAMSFGIPIVTVDGFARKELIEEGKTGFVIKRPDISWKKSTIFISGKERVIQGLMNKVEIIIQDKKLREKMSQNCIEIIKNGKFSIKQRNKKLKKIYLEAIK
ncbi:glycosyltransferase family 4 protein [Candidatus Pacearchaeota archaeon]|jgi:glycosyltransferase involved in cell wall biosynthesis|nr:glycosyltransferase family 4 protein [Candidatus Pacearchaeota archaeon]